MNEGIRGGVFRIDLHGRLRRRWTRLLATFPFRGPALESAAGPR